MKIFQFIIVLQYFFVTVYGRRNFNSLVITQKDGVFQFTKPYAIMSPYYLYDAPDNAKTYHFCPAYERKDQQTVQALSFLMEVQMVLMAKFNDFLKCDIPVTPTLVRAATRDRLEYPINDENIDLYFNAYLLYVKGLRETSTSKKPEELQHKLNEEKEKHEETSDNMEKRMDDFLKGDQEIISTASGPIELTKVNNGANLFVSPFQDDIKTPEIKESELEEPTGDQLDYTTVLGIAIYHHKLKKQTIAVKYFLLSTPLFDKNLGKPIEQYKNEKELDMSSLLEYNKPNKDDEFLRKKIGSKYRKYFGNDSMFLSNVITLMPFAPRQHFQIPLWQLPVEISANLTPIFYKATRTWLKVVSFARIVAKHIGDLRVTVGITDVISIPKIEKLPKVQNTMKADKSQNNEVNPQSQLEKEFEGDQSSMSGMKEDELEKSPKQKKSPSSPTPEVQNQTEILLEEEATNFSMPKYFWSVFEYVERENWHSILVVLHANILTDTTENICEDVSQQSGWLISNSNYKNGKIYACPLTKQSIGKLKADHLPLQERELFDLNKWSEKKESIIKEFNEFV